MAEQRDTRPDGVQGGRGRRWFLAGLASGGLIGSLTTWLTLRKLWKEPPVPTPASSNDSIPADPHLDHATFMRRAIVQAQKVPRLPFGAVIVRSATGEVVAEGHNRTSVNPTFHGEIDAINRLAEHDPKVDWTALALYTTAEPCPMCQSAIEWAGIPLVVFGSSIPFLKGLGWWQIDIRAEEVVRRTPFRKTTVLGGVLETECNALFEAVPGLPREAGK